MSSGGRMEDYSLLRCIGKGSFGKVYLVRHKTERKHYCMKVIKLKGIPRKEREATRNEVMLLQKLMHPNIVAYKDSFFARGRDQLCIAMTYCDGGDLEQRVTARRRKLWKEDQILHYFVQIALGIHYMHQNKVLHRDIKTQNIFLLGNGRLVLGDLGISKVLDGTMAFASTQIGTPYYMSPELFKNKPYNYKSDVWAAGCVLYELATLKHAFDASSLNGLASKIMRGRYAPIPSRFSRPLRQLVDKMLAVNPAERPSFAQILRMPFIKKHICNLIRDISARSSIGDGTMVFKKGAMAAAGMGVLGLDSPVQAEGLMKQLQSLGLQSVIQVALREPDQVEEAKAATSDPRSAKRLLRQRKNALSREQERQRAVEQALQRLRAEKEMRMKQREALRAKQQRVMRGRRGVRGRAAPSHKRIEERRKAALARKAELERKRVAELQAWEQQRRERQEAARAAARKKEADRKAAAQAQVNARLRAAERQRDEASRRAAEVEDAKRRMAALKEERARELEREKAKREQERRRIEEMEKAHAAKKEAERQQFLRAHANRTKSAAERRREQERSDRYSDPGAQSNHSHHHSGGHGHHSSHSLAAAGSASSAASDSAFGAQRGTGGGSMHGTGGAGHHEKHSKPRTRDPFRAASSLRAHAGHGEEGDDPGALRRRSFAHGGKQSGGNVVRRSSSDNLEAYSRHRSNKRNAGLAAAAIPEHGHAEFDRHRVPPPAPLSSHQSAPAMGGDDGLSAVERVRLRKERERREQEAEQKRLLAQARRDNAANRARAAEKERDLYSGKAAAHAAGLPGGGLPPRSDAHRGVPAAGAAPQEMDADAYFAAQQKRMDAEEAAAIAAVRDYKLPGARYGGAAVALASGGSDDDIADVADDGGLGVGYSLASGGGGGGGGGGSGAKSSVSGTKSVLEELDEFVEEGEEGVDDGLSSSDDELLAAVDVDEEGDPDHEVEAALHQELEASSARVAQYQRSLDEYNQAYHEALVKAGAAVGDVVPESDEEEDGGEDTDDEDEFPTQPASFDDDEDGDVDAADMDDGSGSRSSGGGGGRAHRRHLTVDSGAGRDAGAGRAHTPPRGGGARDAVPLTPQGRLDDRIRLLRDRLTRELGRDTFAEVYGYLKEQRWGADAGGGLEVGGEAFGDDGALDSEAAMQRQLARMLGGRDVTKYQRVVEHLLFMENSVGAL